MRQWKALGGALVLATVTAVYVKHRLHSKAESADTLAIDLSKPAVLPAEPIPSVQLPPPAVPKREHRDLDLAHIRLDGNRASARVRNDSSEAPGESIPLTVNPRLQRTAESLLATHHFAEASVVMIDVATGHVLVYASYSATGPARDLAVLATAPAASVFKLVTASALVEDAHLGPNTRKCFAGGGEHGIRAEDLVENEVRDSVCTTLGSALAKSTNIVFGRLAKEHLSADGLEEMARRFGFGEPVPFDVSVEPSRIHVPEGELELARTAAGFWNTTLSPLEAAWMSATIANHGEAIAPSIVSDDAAKPVTAQVIAPETAEALRVMMERTVTEGTSYRSFHGAGSSPDVVHAGVAGKTGTLSSASSNHFFTWFTGFAPTHSTAKPEVAIAALVVNGPSWQLKANIVAREMLRAYLEDDENAPTKGAAVARRRRQ